jgi:hypothetical protein
LTGTEAQARAALTSLGLGFLHNGSAFVNSVHAAVHYVAAPITSPGRNGNSDVTASNPYLLVRFLTSTARAAVEVADLHGGLPTTGLALADALITVKWADFWGDDMPFYDARESGVDPVRTASENQAAIEDALTACEDGNGDKLPILFPRGNILFEKLRLTGSVTDNGFDFRGPGSQHCSLLATLDDDHAVDVPGINFRASGITFGVSGNREINQYTTGVGDGIHLGGEASPAGSAFRFYFEDVVSTGHPRDGVYCARPEFMAGDNVISSGNGRYGYHLTDEGQLVGINTSLRNWRAIDNKNIGWWIEDVINCVLVGPQGIRNAADISGSATQHGGATNSTIKAQMKMQNGRSLTLIQPDFEQDSDGIGFYGASGWELRIDGGTFHDLHTGIHLTGMDTVHLDMPHFTNTFTAGGRRIYVETTDAAFIRARLLDNDDAEDLTQLVQGSGNTRCHFVLNGLPTSDPGVAGMAWLNSGAYSISAG